MVNSWSLLYDVMNEDKIVLNYDRDPVVDYAPGSSLTITGGSFSDSFNSAVKYKYEEDKIIRELLEYVRGTYQQHYSAGDDKIQTLDLIEACGDGEPFCRSNILKYASRYDRKGSARRDILKILHYAVLLLHFNDKNAKRDTYETF
jgi:hypothetical protein